MKTIVSICIAFFSLTLNAQQLSDAKVFEIAKKLNLFAGTKASVQWERVFSSERRMRQYGINTLPSDVQYRLKRFLIKHAADSEQPIVPGL